MDEREPGLSPRGRGNLSIRVISCVLERSIPAWAGEPTTGWLYFCIHRVYPRVGGGTRTMRRQNLQRLGLSPRGRGNPSLRRSRNHGARSIPAWAGEPMRCAWAVSRQRVYPRVGGGTLRYGTMAKRIQGLSPRGRGNLATLLVDLLAAGSIPAWAGEPR